MAVRLLQVGDHLSLEFENADLEAVRSHIRDQFSDFENKPAGIAVEVRFGGQSFTFHNEWDDPCLISGSPEGDDLLRAIHRALA